MIQKLEAAAKKTGDKRLTESANKLKQVKKTGSMAALINKKKAKKPSSG